MNIILFDTEARKNLFPLTLTRAVAEIRMGILTIRERWSKITEVEVFVLTDSYLQSLYEKPAAGEYIFIDASVLPTNELVESILSLSINQAIKDENGFIAGRTFLDNLPTIEAVSSIFKNVSPVNSVQRILFPNDLFLLNKEMIEFDFKLLSKDRVSCKTNNTVQFSLPNNIFIEEGATIEHSILNATAGPVYIGKNATIMESCCIRGPFALCEGAVLKMGTKIYGATTIGPYSTGGGEIKNSIIFGYSNKGHDGYLGDSVIGEWCNMGAGTSNSNVKNTGSTVNLYNYASNKYLPSGNKCGVIMGDYSRTAINSSINTGSVIGVCCNVFGDGLLPTFIPDFSWGIKSGSKYKFDKALMDIVNWKKMKNKTVSEQETKILKHIFDHNTSN